jgi:hypothetical protein
MFEDKRRRQQQINREKAEQYAIIVGMITRNAAAAQRVRQQQRVNQRPKAASRRAA